MEHVKGILAWVLQNIRSYHLANKYNESTDDKYYVFDPITGRCEWVLNPEWRSRVDRVVGLFAGRRLLLTFLAMAKIHSKALVGGELRLLDLHKYVTMLQRFDSAANEELSNFNDQLYSLAWRTPWKKAKFLQNLPGTFFDCFHKTQAHHNADAGALTRLPNGLGVVSKLGQNRVGPIEWQALIDLNQEGFLRSDGKQTFNYLLNISKYYSLSKYECKYFNINSAK